MHRPGRYFGGRRTAAAVAVGLTLSLSLASCGGKKAGEAGGEEGNSAEVPTVETGLADAGDPQRGASLIYGVEADSQGYCLPEGQLAIAGMLVVRAVYDTLTVPNSKGEYVPYLAQSVEPSEDYKTWTITVRDGIKFHNGEDLNGTVVKNNLDAFRGKYEGRSSLLFAFVLSNIESIEAEGQVVTVKTKVPWVAFPAYLYSSSRLGIMAQEQLDDAEGCNDNLIGTGPFKFQSWTRNQELKTVANPDYWQIAPDGDPYPYASDLTFRIIPDGQVRNQSLRGGQVNLIHTTNGEDIKGELLKQTGDGKLNMLVSEDSAEVSFVQLNNTAPPFDDARMRKALAMGADRAEINTNVNAGLPTVAEGPFAPDSIGYDPDSKLPAVDVEEAKRLVEEYVAEGGKPEFTLTSTNDPTVIRLAELIQQRAKSMGVTVTIAKRDQAALINDAIGKKYQAMVFRNYPGGDPDINYVWWYGEANPVNFSGYNDPDINRLLDEGRSEPDAAKRAEIYKELSAVFAENVYSLWAWFTPWAIATAPNVHNILGPPLPGPDASVPSDPDDPDLQPATGLATGHSLIGLWSS